MAGRPPYEVNSWSSRHEQMPWEHSNLELARKESQRAIDMLCTSHETGFPNLGNKYSRHDPSISNEFLTTYSCSYPNPPVTYRMSREIGVPFYESDEAGSQMFRVKFDLSQYDPASVRLDTRDSKIIVSAREERSMPSGMVSKEFRRELQIPPGVNFEALSSTMTAGQILQVEAPINSTPNSNSSTLVMKLEKPGSSILHIESSAPTVNEAVSENRVAEPFNRPTLAMSPDQERNMTCVTSATRCPSSTIDSSSNMGFPGQTVHEEKIITTTEIKSPITQIAPPNEPAVFRLTCPVKLYNPRNHLHEYPRRKKRASGYITGNRPMSSELFGTPSQSHGYTVIETSPSPIGYNRSMQQMSLYRPAPMMTYQDARHQIVADIEDFQPEEIDVRAVDGKVIIKGHKEAMRGGTNESKEMVREYILPSNVDGTSCTLTYPSPGRLLIQASYR